ncbi:MAG: carbohydrate-binding domain-containing protein [Lachnospiraceae bacterium]|nr:carbohydrate-binding domain-containing protein [Lachnospiraceae bacterium]
MHFKKVRVFLALLTAATLAVFEPATVLAAEKVAVVSEEADASQLSQEETSETLLSSDVTITLGEGTATSSEDTASKVTIEASENGVSTVTINEAGTYTLTGDGSGLAIAIKKGLTDGVTLILSNATIDNQNYNTKAGEDAPVIECGQGTPLTLSLEGSNTIYGSSSYTTEPEALISVKKDGNLTVSGTGSLILSDKMSDETIDARHQDYPLPVALPGPHRHHHPAASADFEQRYQNCQNCLSRPECHHRHS